MTSRRRKILVVDDDPAMRESFNVLLGSWGYEVLLACDAHEAQTLAEKHDPDIVITDVVMPEVSGLELLRDLKAGNPDRPVLLITARGSIDMAVEAIKQGARDFLTKPVTDFAKLRALIADAESDIELRRKARRLAARVETDGLFGDFVGASKVMRDIFRNIETVATRDIPVMITGESGTGKELAAQAIHRLSSRSDKPFIAVNAAAIPETLIESEVFGHERGAFTGATGTRPGCFEQAHEGTLFLDEIAEMPVLLQPKLLRVLADGKVRRLGGNREFAFDVRVIVATNRDPLQAIRDGRLREDLYYRLNVFAIALPPLRERQDDVPLLAQRFITEFNQKHKTSIAGLSDGAAGLLRAYTWPGNVRELRNVVERAVVLAGNRWIEEADLPPYLSPNGTEARRIVLAAGTTTMAAAERELLLRTLEVTGNNKAETARLLGLDVKTIYNKLKSYDIEL